MNSEHEETKLLRTDEAMKLLREVNNPITAQLMNMAHFALIKRFVHLRKYPDENLDLNFFMEVMLDFCSDHETLRRVLAGEDIRAWDDKEL